MMKLTRGRFMWANRPYTWQRKAAPAGGREGVCVVSLVGWLRVVSVLGRAAALTAFYAYKVI